jgi:outer membrane protein OmpA-like peptidoglycan-associated protein
MTGQNDFQCGKHASKTAEGASPSTAAQMVDGTKANPVWQTLALSTKALHPKLRGGQPDDHYEQAADHVADRVMRMTEPQSQQTYAWDSGGSSGFQTGPPNHSAATKPSLVPELGHSSGQLLDPSTRGLMESRFGHDFNNVRVHTDETAAQSAQAIDALAFAVGRDVFLGSHQYRPQTETGNRLLAHELTHVVQSGAAPQKMSSDVTWRGAESGRVAEPIVTRAQAISAPQDPAEREAEMIADRVVRGATVPEVAAVPSAATHRKPAPTTKTDEAPSQFFPKQPSPDLAGLLFFPTGSHTLGPDDVKVVEQVVNDAAEASDFNEIEFRTYGFADERPVAGDPQGNQKLSESRATAVKLAILVAIEALPEGLRKKALKRSNILDRGLGVRTGGADLQFKRNVEIKYRNKLTLLQLGRIKWDPAEPERIIVAASGITPRKLAIELYGDEDLATKMTFIWDKNTEGPLTVDSEIPIGKAARIQYPSLRPHVKQSYDKTIVIISRSKWGARPPILGDPNRSYDSYTGKLEDILTGIVVHHSGNSNMHTMKEVQDHHLDEKEAADINYHYGIDLQGQTYEGRPINVKGAHVKGANTGNIGIVLLADLDEGTFESNDTLTSPMEAALLRLIHYLMGKYPKVTFLGGHLEFAAGRGDDRSCPGNLTMVKMAGWRSSTTLNKP